MIGGGAVTQTVMGAPHPYGGAQSTTLLGAAGNALGAPGRSAQAALSAAVTAGTGGVGAVAGANGDEWLTNCHLGANEVVDQIVVAAVGHGNVDVYGITRCCCRYVSCAGCHAVGSRYAVTITRYGSVTPLGGHRCPRSPRQSSSIASISFPYTVTSLCWEGVGSDTQEVIEGEQPTRLLGRRDRGDRNRRPGSHGTGGGCRRRSGWVVARGHKRWGSRASSWTGLRLGRAGSRLVLFRSRRSSS